MVLLSLCTPAEPRTEELGGNDPETKVVEVETELTCGNKAGVVKGKEGDFALAFDSLANLTIEPRDTARSCAGRRRAVCQRSYPPGRGLSIMQEYFW